MSTQPRTHQPIQSKKAPSEAERAKLIEDAAKRKSEAEAGTPAPRARTTAPWQDLEPTSDKPTAPRDKTVFAAALACILSRPDGATLEEMKECFRQMPGSGPDRTMYHHDPKTLLRWQNVNRGWGFKMDPKTQRITIWSK